MKTRFVFQLGFPTNSGAIYTMDMLTALDKFIEESGLIVMFNGGLTYDKYDANDMIGIATHYTIQNNFVFISFNIINKRFDALKNLPTSPLCIPLIQGDIDPITNEVKVHAIDALVVEI